MHVNQEAMGKYLIEKKNALNKFLFLKRIKTIRFLMNINDIEKSTLNSEFYV